MWGGALSRLGWGEVEGNGRLVIEEELEEEEGGEEEVGKRKRMVKKTAQEKETIRKE